VIDLVSQKQTKCLAELELSTCFKEVRLLKLLTLRLLMSYIYDISRLRVNKLIMIRIIIIIIIIIIILATAFTVSLHMPESSNDTKCSTFSFRKLIIL